MAKRKGKEILVVFERSVSTDNASLGRDDVIEHIMR